MKLSVIIAILFKHIRLLYFLKSVMTLLLSGSQQKHPFVKFRTQRSWVRILSLRAIKKIIKGFEPSRFEFFYYLAYYDILNSDYLYFTSYAFDIGGEVWEHEQGRFLTNKSRLPRIIENCITTKRYGEK